MLMPCCVFILWSHAVSQFENFCTYTNYFEYVSPFILTSMEKCNVLPRWCSVSSEELMCVQTPSEPASLPLYHCCCCSSHLQACLQRANIHLFCFVLQLIYHRKTYAVFKYIYMYIYKISQQLCYEKDSDSVTLLLQQCGLCISTHAVLVHWIFFSIALHDIGEN